MSTQLTTGLIRARIPSGTKSAGRVILLLAGLLSLCACGTLPNGRLWGEDATLFPGWDRVRVSAVEAARDPWVWGPLIGAAVFQIDDWDRRTSDWAREHTPIFGSQRSAEEWSDDLREASALAHYATVAATPGGEDPSEWFVAKAKGVLVGVAAISTTSALTQALKSSADRERPNGMAEQSFPSGHTSSAAVHTRLASENLQSIEMSRGTRRALDIGLYSLTIGTSWARIEAGWHYPSDTLFGMALGHFVASFINDAFMGLENGESTIAIITLAQGAVVEWSWRF